MISSPINFLYVVTLDFLVDFGFIFFWNFLGIEYVLQKWASLTCNEPNMIEIGLAQNASENGPEPGSHSIYPVQRAYTMQTHE